MTRPKPVTSHWVFALSRFLGATPFDSEGKTSQFSRNHFVSTTIAVSLMPVFMAIIALVLPHDEYPDDEDPFSGFKMLIGLFVQLALTATSYQQVLLCFSKSPNSLVHIFRHLTVDSSRDFKAFKCFFISLIVYFVTGSVELYCAFSPSRTCRGLNRNVLPAFGALSLNLYNSIYILQFRLVLMTVNNRVKFLTEIIIPRGKIYSQGFYRFLGVAKRLNRLYRKQLFYMLTQIVVNGVTHAYFLLHGIMYGTMLQDIPILTYTLNLVVLKACDLFLITKGPEEFKKRAEAFYNELFKLMRENKHLCKDNKLLLYVTVRQSVNFTACGFFNLGYPLVTSIITAVTTYLVILIQFSMPPSKT